MTRRLWKPAKEKAAEARRKKAQAAAAAVGAATSTTAVGAAATSSTAASDPSGGGGGGAAGVVPSAIASGDQTEFELFKNSALTIMENTGGAFDEDQALKAASEIRTYDKERDAHFSFDLI